VTVHLPTPEQRQFFESAASQYQLDLRTDTSAQAYLTGRGISAQVAATFRLGVLRRPLLGHEAYANRLSVPYLTPAGVVTFTFRCIERHTKRTEVVPGNNQWVDVPASCGDRQHPKYLAPEGADRTLFNVLDLKKDSPVLYVCEGEIDTIILSSLGYPAVGVPGVENWKTHFSKCLEDYAQVYVVCDGDDPGHKLGSFLAREVRARSIRLPRGEDVNSLYVKGGSDALSEVLAGQA
jgi:DNA primase